MACILFNNNTLNLVIGGFLRGRLWLQVVAGGLPKGCVRIKENITQSWWTKDKKAEIGSQISEVGNRKSGIREGASL